MNEQVIKLIMDFGHSREDAEKLAGAVGNIGPAAEKAAGAADKLAGQSGSGGRGLLGASYAFQDFASVLTGGGGLARAMGAITNNFDQLAQAAGASVATAAKLSFAFTGFTALLPIVIPMVKDLWDAFAGGDGKGPEPVIKALDAVEERLKRIRAEAEAMMKAMTSEEEETAKNFREFLGKQESGMGQKVVGGLAQAIGASGRGAQMNEAERAATSDDTIEAAVDAVQRATPRPLTDAEKDQVRARARQAQQAARDAAQKRINEANVEAAGRLFGAAPTERGARDTMRALGTQFPGAFPKGFAGQMGELEPDAMRAAEQADAAAEAREQRAIEAGKRRRKAEADAAKAAREDNRSRQANAEGLERLRRDRDNLPMPPAAQLRQGDRQLWQFEAATIEARAMQRGGATPAEQQRLQRLAEKLGKDMPSYEQVQMMQAQVQQGLVSNQASFAQKMDMANRAIRELQQINRNINSSPMPSGLPR
jgi:hypothetical protein